MNHENSATRQDWLAQIEFEYLYKEIHDNAEKVYAISHAAILATMAFFGFIAAVDATKLGFEIRNSLLPIVFIVPLIILIPSMVMITSRLNATIRCAMYIMCIYERGPVAPCWQWALQQYREECKEKGLKGRFLGKGLNLLLPVIAAVCIALSFVSSVLFTERAYVVSGISALFSDEASRSFVVICVYVVVQALLMIIVWRIAQGMRTAWDTEAFRGSMKCWEGILHPTRLADGVGKPAIGTGCNTRYESDVE